VERKRVEALRRDRGLVHVQNFCTVMHTFPQSLPEKPLAKFSVCSYYAHRLIGKKNFTSQFREGGKGKTEQASIELN
jgi:hypothetical protein